MQKVGDLEGWISKHHGMRHVTSGHTNTPPSPPPPSSVLTWCARPKLYFVKVDVRACFDTIDQTRLLAILREVLSEVLPSPPPPAFLLMVCV